MILIDGQRMNPLDMSGIDWSIIPLASIERIEIMRGAGSVLYGDRATGGVINIVTDKSARTAASASVGVGSFNSRSADGEISYGGNAGYGSLKPCSMKAPAPPDPSPRMPTGRTRSRPEIRSIPSVRKATGYVRVLLFN